MTTSMPQSARVASADGDAGLTLLAADAPSARLATPTFELTHLLEYLDSSVRGRVEFLGRSGWSQKTYCELAADVRRAAEYLRRAGVQAEQRVGIVGTNCYAWVVCDLALIALRAISVAIVESGEHAISDDAERYGLSLVLGLQELPNCEAAVLAREAAELCGASTYRFAVAAPESSPNLDFEEPALIFSSGSSGRQKCLRISRRGIAHLVESFNRIYPAVSGDRILIFLPLSNVQQRLIVYGAIWLDVEIVLVTPHQLFRALKEGRPSVVVAPPLFYETIHGRYLGLAWYVRAMAAAATTLASFLPAAPRAKLLRGLYGSVHEGLGGNLRVMITGMAHIRRATLRFFQRAGFPLCEAYGLTECGLVSGNPPGKVRLGSVGLPFDAGSVKIAADSEIIVTRRHLLARGYLDEQDADEVFARDDTVCTGDLGHFDADGYLYIDGRKKDMIVTAGGYKVQPEVLELTIMDHAEVECCAVLATDGARSLYAVVGLRSTAASGAEQRVRQFISDGNARLPVASRIVHVTFTPKPFSVETGTRTRNLKLDRRAVARQFPYDEA